MLPPGLSVRVTALCGIWSLLPRSATPDAWNFTICDSRLWEIIALTALSNNNNNPSWLLSAQSVGIRGLTWGQRGCAVGSEREESSNPSRKQRAQSCIASLWSCLETWSPDFLVRAFPRRRLCLPMLLWVFAHACSQQHIHNCQKGGANPMSTDR